VIVAHRAAPGINAALALRLRRRFGRRPGRGKREEDIMAAIRRRLLVVAAVTATCVAMVASPRDRLQSRLHDLTLPRFNALAGPTFHERVSTYVSLHQGLVRTLASRGVPPEAGVAFRRALAAAIRGARHDARAGDLFCGSVAPAIRGTVRGYFATQPASVWSVLLSEMPSALPLRVNDSYPEGEALVSMPALLLQKLEPLPEELQYRFFNDSLILLDADAGLIVDLLPGVVPNET
jgi:hypothetical protein